ncbi:hypothetical protein GALMADRAFT_138903 [Galerina marginata CBS 339.88]|uniref:Uncharacterized protein n=1 Tax=Galerina marginata (strain CBS 339.88) TaxID=685588 RepID=A0A067T3F5_GALM3|nr:hypothetical protein GALMADRAFT_138903 [Galerina marginata CBS 339.88]
MRSLQVILLCSLVLVHAQLIRHSPGVTLTPVSSLGVPAPYLISGTKTQTISATALTTRPIFSPTSVVGPSQDVSVILPATTAIAKRAAIAACLNTVELSCLNLAANCIDTVSFDTINDLWGIQSCVAAATCYGVGNLINSVECQTGSMTTNAAQASLDYANIYAPIVGSCAYATGGCHVARSPVTQQNYVDFYYGTLSNISTANYPSSNAVVIAYWQAIYTWAATGANVPYTNFNDWLHYSTYPTATATASTTTAPIATISYVEWNPNPYPPTTAISETFVFSKTTVVIPIPTTTVTVTIAGTTVVVASGGTPVGSPLPTAITISGAITPTWNDNIIPPTSGASVTFTAPPSYTSIVAAPASSSSPPKNITGPPGDRNKNGDDWWLLIFGLGGPIISGLLPLDVGILGGTTPIPIPPAVWTGPWNDPQPSQTSQSSSTSTTTSTTSSSSSCPTIPSSYTLPDDAENADWEDDGTDPDTRRRRSNTLTERASPRHIAVNGCSPSLQQSSASAVTLSAGLYLSIGTLAQGGTGTTLTQQQVNSKPPGGNNVNQEHVFELGYITQFFAATFAIPSSCDWIRTVWNFERADGLTTAVALVQAIDQTNNMVWVDKPLNQAKSNVVNGNKATAGDPPMNNNIVSITDFTTSAATIFQMEYFIRNIAALGPYFGSTANVFQATALAVQNILSEVTPSTPVNPSLPSLFNSWLRNLLSTYPNGCTSRATNTMAKWRAVMLGVSLQTGQPVPACHPMYTAPYTPGTFTWMNLIPPAPALPVCDTPGTHGGISLSTTSAGTPNYIAGNGAIADYTVTGSGNTNFFAMGRSGSLSGSHWIGSTIPSSYSACNGIYQLFEGTPTVGFVDANVALQCGSQTGNMANVNFEWVIGGQQVDCLLLNNNDGSSQFAIICGPTQAAANTCGVQILSASTNLPHATISVPTWTFRPS